MRDDRDRLLDLGTKGSGTTPWSRRGDGRLTLKGGVREVLATEMLEALGVNTSKTFALFETGEALYRGDEPSPTRSAVLTRLSHGHIRIGSFQRLAFFEDSANLAKLTRYCLAKLFGEVPANDDADQCRAPVRPCRDRAPPVWPHPTWQRDSFTACSTATISTSPAKASIMARGVSRPNGIPASPRLISTIMGFTPSAASPRRSIGMSPSSPAASR